MSEAPQTGTCRCGEVSFRVTGAPLLTAACHCGGCKRMSASAYSLSSAYPEEAFELVNGEPVIGGLHGATRHYFCPHCKSWMFTRPEGMDGLVNIRTTMFDRPDAAPPFIEFFRNEAFAWAQTGAVHSYATAPESGEFPALLAEFAAIITKEPTP